MVTFHDVAHTAAWYAVIFGISDSIIQPVYTIACYSITTKLRLTATVITVALRYLLKCLEVELHLIPALFSVVSGVFKHSMPHC